jgi:hypothetical protein
VRKFYKHHQSTRYNNYKRYLEMGGVLHHHFACFFHCQLHWIVTTSIGIMQRCLNDKHFSLMRFENIEEFFLEPDLTLTRPAYLPIQPMPPIVTPRYQESQWKEVFSHVEPREFAQDSLGWS